MSEIVFYRKTYKNNKQQKKTGKRYLLVVKQAFLQGSLSQIIFFVFPLP